LLVPGRDLAEDAPPLDAVHRRRVARPHPRRSSRRRRDHPPSGRGTGARSAPDRPCRLPIARGGPRAFPNALLPGLSNKRIPRAASRPPPRRNGHPRATFPPVSRRNGRPRAAAPPVSRTNGHPVPSPRRSLEQTDTPVPLTGRLLDRSCISGRRLDRC
jgi:hypothetical protein